MFFYTKPGCKLCEEAKEQLQTYQLMYDFKILEHNIEEDDTLLETYFLTIPVVKIGEEELNASSLNAGTLDDFITKNLAK
ncbi:glutaredoxin family protein [Piscibacillus sp. B03]|uniref:glutaredoxin family protein n=1 Tax=Piscibacillus sp. B03 TaxID=3457430 RepID=UPI003FCD0F26